MRQMEQEIEMAYIHMEWNSKEVSDTTFEKIENYLTEIHGNTYSYRIYSPEIDFQNNGYKVKESIQLLMHLGGLFLLIFLWESYRFSGYCLTGVRKHMASAFRAV